MAWVPVCVPPLWTNCRSRSLMRISRTSAYSSGSRSSSSTVLVDRWNPADGPNPNHWNRTQLKVATPPTMEIQSNNMAADARKCAGRAARPDTTGRSTSRTQKSGTSNW
jgi:hypothetical protein